MRWLLPWWEEEQSRAGLKGMLFCTVTYLQYVDDEEYINDDDERLRVFGIKPEDIHPDSILS